MKTIVCDAINSIQYWRSNKHKTCYKCREKGHKAEHCEEICKYCKNKHAKFLCPFLLDKILGKLENVLKFNKFTTQEEVILKIKQANIDVQIDKITENIKNECKRLQNLNQISKEIELNFNASQTNLVQQIENVKEMLKDKRSVSNKKKKKDSKEELTISNTKNDLRELENLLSQEPERIKRRNNIIKKVSYYPVHANNNLIDLYKREIKSVKMNEKLEKYKESVIQFRTKNISQKFQNKQLNEMRLDIQRLKEMRNKLNTMENLYKNGLHYESITKKIKDKESELNKIQLKINNKNEIITKIINNAKKKAEKIFIKQKNKESKRQIMLDRQQEKLDRALNDLSKQKQKFQYVDQYNKKLKNWLDEANNKLDQLKYEELVNSKD